MQSEDENNKNNEKKEGTIITPWTVKLENSDAYVKIVRQFGCQKIDNSISVRLQSLGIPVHRFIRRGMVFAHRDFDILLDSFKQGERFYIYTGRGPSSPVLHLGHIIPFVFTKYLQDAFDTPLVIQLTDDEKFLWKELTTEEAYYNAIENAKDIVALGFDPKKTFIFINSRYSSKFDQNTLKISKLITLNDAIKIFGFDKESNIGQIHFPAKEIAPCFSNSFPFLKEKMKCLVPSAIDQDPFFRAARDISKKMNYPKPSTIYSAFLPDLRGVNAKMSASDPNSSIFMNDTKEEIRRKIMRYAFSGGRETIQEHKNQGGNVDIDVAYQYLTYFLEDDVELERLRSGYENGTILSKEMKEKCVEVIWDFIEKFQEKRSSISDHDLESFFNDTNKIIE